METQKNTKNRNSNLASTTEDLWVEVFEEFTDLPSFKFNGSESLILTNEELEVRYQPVSHYVVYRIDYVMMPEHHPEKYNYIIYDITELEENRRKVYKIFTKDMEEITLGEATYDIGLLFSGGRVFSDTHFIEMRYKN